MEEENADACRTDTLSETFPLALQEKTRPCTQADISGTEGSPSYNAERSRSATKVQSDNESVGSTYSKAPGKLSVEMESASDILQMVQMVFVKEESISCDETWQNKMEYEHELPVSTNIEECEEVDEHDTSVKELSKQMSQQPDEEHGTLSSGSQIVASSQSLSVEVSGRNNQTHYLEDSFCPEDGTLRSEGSISQFPIASCPTAVVEVVQEESADRYLLEEHGGKEVAKVRQMQHTVESEAGSSTDCEETQFERERENSSKRNKTKSRKPAFECSICKKTFTRKWLFVRHTVVHRDEKPFSCSECGKTFTQSNNLIVHMRTHTGEKPFKCCLCRKSFRQSGTLTTHMRVHTGDRPYICSQCGESFTRKSDLTIHVRSHSGESPFNCSQCGKSFKTKSKLNVHMRTHSGEKPFKCAQCGKSFAYSSTLAIHERNHAGDRPYKCSHCGVSFLLRCHLIVHMRVHSGEKPFKCSQCEKAFSTKSYLTVHLRTHSGEKPYTCTTCGKHFTRSNNLQFHRLNEHATPSSPS